MRIDTAPLAVTITLALAAAAPARGDDQAIASRDSFDADVAEVFRLDLGAVQDAPATATSDAQDDWRVDVIAWVWLTAMTGDMRVGPVRASVDASFTDILDASDSLLAFTGRLEIGKGRWAGFIESMYADIGAEDQTGALGLATVDASTQMFLMDFGVSYRAWERVASNGGGRSHALDVFGGGRYQDLSAEVDPALLRARSRSKSWLDPIVGARATIQLSRRLDVTLLGDIGGFGVGSDLTWSLRGVFGWHFTMFDHPSTLYAGYAALGTDYADGSGLKRFEWDMVLHGPVLGLQMSF